MKVKLRVMRMLYGRLSLITTKTCWVVHEDVYKSSVLGHNATAGWRSQDTSRPAYFLLEVETAVMICCHKKRVAPTEDSQNFINPLSMKSPRFYSEYLLNPMNKNTRLSCFITSQTVRISKSDDPEKRRFVGSYRPISLANSDYKIFMKVWSRKMRSSTNHKSPLYLRQ